jgi:hypothetical protein
VHVFACRKKIRSMETSENQEFLGYPPPPAYYTQFESGSTAMQPPDVGSLGPTYRMFGRVVQNPTFPENADFTPPPIDRDVLVYDPKGPLKTQITGMIETLPTSVLGLLEAIQNSPTNTARELRDLDNRVKSLFHALECLRPYEAKRAVIELAEQEVKIREDVNGRCKDVINVAKSLLP